MGPECVRFGVQEVILLSYVKSSTCRQQATVVIPKVPLVSNKLVLELLCFKDQHAQCTYRTMYCWLQDLFGKRWPKEAAPSLQSLTKSIERLKAKQSKLKKQHTGVDKEATLETFLHQGMYFQVLVCVKVVYFTSVQQSRIQSKLCKPRNGPLLLLNNITINLQVQVRLIKKYSKECMP